MAKVYAKNICQAPVISYWDIAMNSSNGIFWGHRPQRFHCFHKEKCTFLHITKEHSDVKTTNYDGVGWNKYNKGLNTVVLGCLLIKAQLMWAGESRELHWKEVVVSQP